MEAHYISAFSLQDKQKISNMLLSSRACTCGLKQQTNYSPFKGSLLGNTQTLMVRAQKCPSFSREKGFLHISHWFGYRMNSQGAKRKQRSFTKSLSSAPLIFYFKMCFRSKLSLFLLWITLVVPYIWEAVEPMVQDTLRYGLWSQNAWALVLYEWVSWL